MPGRAAAGARRPRVLLDCDTGIDDALALIYLAGRHLAGELELVGVTCTAGNTSAEQAARNSRFVLERCAPAQSSLRQVPIAAGCDVPLEVPLVTTPETHGATGLGYLTAPTTAVGRDWRGVWDRAAARGSQLIVTGPATNLAAYGPWPGPVTLMGGAYEYPGNTTPTAEWNSWVDPHAARLAFQEATHPITVCSLGVTERFTINPERLSELQEALGCAPVAELLPELLRFYFEFHRAQGEGYLAQIHDLLTCIIALGAVRYEHTLGEVDVETRGERRGTTTASPGSAARIVSDADIAAVHEEALRAFRLLAPAAAGSLG